MRRGSFVVVLGMFVLGMYSAVAGFAVNQLSAAQQAEPLDDPPERYEAAAVEIAGVARSEDAFVPVDPATQQIAMQVEHAPLVGDAAPEPISIPTPTAGFAGMALLGILLIRRRLTHRDPTAH